MSEKKDFEKGILKNATVDLDGNALCVMPKDFINLAESEAFFVTLTSKQIHAWRMFVHGEKMKELEE